jgi:hypothetical protein
MPRLFVGNFEFEHTLANPHFQLPERLKRLNAELATSWLAVAEDGDLLWCPQFVSIEFFRQLADSGLPRVYPITDYAEAGPDVELVPWGWTDALIQKARLNRWTFCAPPANTIHDVNARQFSFDLETEWETGLPEASAIREPDQLDTALSRAASVCSRAVIKANWGMSARERILIGGPLAEADRSWIRKRLAEQQVVFVEPWVERVEEIGIQLQIPQMGTPELLGITALVCDDAGQYRGSWFTKPTNSGDDFHERWQPAVEIALRAAERLQSRGYFGPLGIDAMRYRLPDGSIHLRPLQDINARWTMGQLSLGWRKFLREAECGFWRQGPRNEEGAAILANVQSHRMIRLLPEKIGDQPVLHESVLAFFKA